MQVYRRHYLYCPFKLFTCFVFFIHPGQAGSSGEGQPGVPGAAHWDGVSVEQLLRSHVLSGRQAETAGAGRQGWCEVLASFGVGCQDQMYLMVACFVTCHFLCRFHVISWFGHEFYTPTQPFHENMWPMLFVCPDFFFFFPGNHNLLLRKLLFGRRRAGSEVPWLEGKLNQELNILLSIHNVSHFN